MEPTSKMAPPPWHVRSAVSLRVAEHELATLPESNGFEVTIHGDRVVLFDLELAVDIFLQNVRFALPTSAVELLIRSTRIALPFTHEDGMSFDSRHQPFAEIRRVCEESIRMYASRVFNVHPSARRIGSRCGIKRERSAETHNHSESSIGATIDAHASVTEPYTCSANS